MKGFEDLDTWKEAREFRKLISGLSRTFPVEEKYKLTDQSLRSSRSISANIAEGHGRFHFQENMQFCRQARGSLTETLVHMICALDEGYIDDSQLEAVRTQYNNVLRLINGYIAYLKKRKTESLITKSTN